MAPNTTTEQQAGSCPKKVTYMDPDRVSNDYAEQRMLGVGSDGTVKLYKHTTNEKYIAVKYPRDDKWERDMEYRLELLESRKKELRKELLTMRTLGDHPTIIEMFGWNDDWKPNGPAIFFEYCSLGDTLNYREKVLTSLQFVPEHTLWKLFLDMSKAFDFIHNSRDIRIIHGDVKPENILVADGPLLNSDNGVTSLPNFKLADFSRSEEYRPEDALFDDGSKGYCGTWCYAPPYEEQYEYQTPAADIWSLGATLQFLATGNDPLMDASDFIKYMTAKGLFNDRYMPTLKELKEGSQMECFEFWPVIYRPLMDVGYSIELNKWYAMCLVTDRSRRIPSAELVKWFVPMAERQINVLLAKWEASATPIVRPCSNPVAAKLREKYSWE